MGMVRFALCMACLTARPGGRLVLATLLALPLALLIPGAQSTCADGWAVQCLDCPIYLGAPGERDVQLDGAGHPHMVYGSSELYYAWHDGSKWQHETVDGASDVGAPASLALDASGRPHIAYFDETNEAIKYAYKVGSAWRFETIDPWIDRDGTFISLALDGGGRPHVSYVQGGESSESDDVWYAYQDDAGWHREEVFYLSGLLVKSLSMALDAQGGPSIVFSHEEVTHIQWNYRDGSGWHWTDIELGYQVDDLSLALNAEGDGRIAYDSYAGLGYVYHDASGWHTEIVDAEQNAGEYNALVLDSNGYPHISYFGGPGGWPNPDLKYAYWDGTNWHVEVVQASMGGSSWGSALALNVSGQAGILYVQQGDLYYAIGGGGVWQAEIVREGGTAGLASSLAVDFSGRSHVAYYGHNRLNYGYQKVSGWQFQTIDGPGSFSAISLQLDPNEVVYVIYRDYIGSDNHPLRYGYLGVTGWYTETVDPQGGAHTSFVFDAAGKPHISYAYAGDVWYGYRDGTGWHLEIAASAGGSSGTSLVLDGTGAPHIAYYDWTYPYELRQVYKDATDWYTETIASAGWGMSSAQQASMAIDANGYLHVSFYSEYQLKYAYQDDFGWQVEIVDAYGGPYHSLALDGAGNPHIAYYQTLSYDLGYADRDGSGWHLQTIDSEGDVGMYPSLALDGHGWPRITYFDSSNSDLKYAYYFEADHALYLPLAIK